MEEAVRLSWNFFSEKSFCGLNDSIVMDALVVCHLLALRWGSMRFSPVPSKCRRLLSPFSGAPVRCPLPDRSERSPVRSRTASLRRWRIPFCSTQGHLRFLLPTYTRNLCCVSNSGLRICVDYCVIFQVAANGYLQAASCPAVDWHSNCVTLLRLPMRK